MTGVIDQDKEVVPHPDDVDLPHVVQCKSSDAPVTCLACLPGCCARYEVGVMRV